jgi:outer membrane receptor protein involved in Fe transport
VTAPVNGQDATVKGIEAAWQHSLGDSGFGFQLNGTLVGSNRHLDAQNLANKFALTGLSNSANAVVFYDKNGIERASRGTGATASCNILPRRRSMAPARR